MDQALIETRAAAPDAITLAIDVGGTRLKVGLLDPAGTMIAGPARVATPKPATPDAVTAALLTLVAGLEPPPFDRISVGFPGVVRGGHVLTAPNLGTEAWRGHPLAVELGRHLGRPVRLLNDATVQGLGVIARDGLECVITLGTGMGFALFQHGSLTPHMEMGQFPVRKDVSYDRYVGSAALAEVGPKRWNRRVARVLDYLHTLLLPDALLVGGGNAKHVDFALPERTRIVSNEAGITGGVRLWDAGMERAFDVSGE